jgi:hypothetical protein
MKNDSNMAGNTITEIPKKIFGKKRSIDKPISSPLKLPRTISPVLLKAAAENCVIENQLGKETEKFQFKFDPVINPFFHSIKPMPISHLMNTSISEGINISEKDQEKIKAKEQHIKEQQDNLKFIRTTLDNLSNENCHLKRLDSLNGILPKAQDIEHVETKLLHSIEILETILKYINIITGRDLIDTIDKLREKINKLKDEQAEIELARKKAYEKNVDNILTNLTINLEKI